MVSLVLGARPLLDGSLDHLSAEADYRAKLVVDGKSFVEQIKENLLSG
jgi:hypothetical protein